MKTETAKTYWCGFVNGEPYTPPELVEGIGIVYPSLCDRKMSVEKYFEDVRKVKIVEVQ